MLKKSLILLLAGIIIPVPVLSDEFQSSTYADGAAVYLKLPAHAYSASLSSAVTAWKKELGGIQYNPAVLDAAERYHLTGSHAFMTYDRVFQAVDLAIPVGEFLVLGGSFRTLGVDDIEERDKFGNLEGTFSERENSFAVSIAGRLKWNISWGARLRYLNQYYKTIEDGTAHGIGIDAGALYQPIDKLNIGISVLNMGSRLWWATGHMDKVLTEARLGVAGLFLDQALVVEGDIAKNLTQPVDVSLGVEYTIIKIVGIRGGIHSAIDIHDKEIRDPGFSLGIGMRYRFIGFDYSFFVPRSELGPTHKISVIANISR